MIVGSGHSSRHLGHVGSCAGHTRLQPTLCGVRVVIAPVLPRLGSLSVSSLPMIDAYPMPRSPAPNLVILLYAMPRPSVRCHQADEVFEHSVTWLTLTIDHHVIISGSSVDHLVIIFCTLRVYTRARIVPSTELGYIGMHLASWGQGDGTRWHACNGRAMSHWHRGGGRGRIRSPDRGPARHERVGWGPGIRRVCVDR